MAHNKLTNISYFCKRLRDNGYNVIKIYDEYNEADPRCWTVVIEPRAASVFCTLYKNASIDNLKESEIGHYFFEFYDGGQFLPNMKYKTLSMEVIIEHLIKHGINPSYTYKKPEFDK